MTKHTLKPPFEIYRNGVDISDASGHLCTAEDPSIANAIVAALRLHYPQETERAGWPRDGFINDYD